MQIDGTKKKILIKVTKTQKDEHGMYPLIGAYYL